MQELFETERCIQGNGFDVVFKSEIFLRNTDGICGTVAFHIHAEASGTVVDLGFHLHGNDIIPDAGDKIHLGLAAARPVVQTETVDRQLIIHVIFRKSAFEKIKQRIFAQNIFIVDILTRTAKTRVIHIEFEIRQGTVCVEGKHDLLNAVILAGDTGQTQPLNRTFKFRCPTALLDVKNNIQKNIQESIQDD